MTVYLLHDGTKVVSIGSVVADPLPDGVTAVAVTADEARAAKDGLLRWTPQDGVTILPPDPSETNRDTIVAKLHQALTANDKFLALASPTNAQTLAQVRTLTRETTALIRLAVDALDTTDGT